MGTIITPLENNKQLTRLWLWQSVGALALSGLFAVFLVMARSPHLGELLPYKDFFKTTLTIHVNLSVLIWLTSMCCMMMACRTVLPKAGYAGFVLCLIGTLAIAAGIFDVSADAYLNNYIPMLNSKMFEGGIGIYLVGLMIAALQGYRQDTDSPTMKYFGVTCFIIILVSIVVLMMTYNSLQLPENKGVYSEGDGFERLFWGFGHCLQFLYVNCMIFALGLIAVKGESAVLKVAFALNLLFAATGIYIINNYDVTSFEYERYFTLQMIVFGGVASAIAAVAILPGLYKNYKSISAPIRGAALWSIILFAAGGIISMFIEESSTIIPAHYHGSIIGVSLALMGMAYVMLPELGHKQAGGWMAKVQPALYGSGQLIHIIGFAISGGYGAMRKAPGEELAAQAKVYMGLMGLGGLISIIGGLFFVIVIFKCLATKRN